ncbi:hypothetical protein [Streptomyces sp. NBC_01803]|uniref:hypothetical protein n=1 Tax=Streptomyces sp. NBC_01803 TaxID=2975946 RepID=UPI002DDAB56C|nr:hypothetical protein [Streptomyces sp. NBC_01803]WSA44197.1 hypothetical protein OIE51_08245 [Streptomyces sp. NBC_01803]
MWPKPEDPGVVRRMRTAHQRAAAHLGTLAEPGAWEAWGWRGRTLSRPVTATDGRAWLRLAARTGQLPDPTFWDGAIEAEKTLPGSIPRPRLRAWHDWTDGPWHYRAELYDHISTLTIAATRAPTTMPSLPSTWWNALSTALDTIAAVPTHRVTLHQRFLDRAMPRYLGTAISTTAPSWSTAHGDLHYANLCAPALHLLDWEGWGRAPTGYDAAMLHSYSLLVPPLAARVRREAAHILDTPAGRFAELAVIAELLDTTAQGDNLDLADPLRHRASHLLGREVPAVAVRQDA